MPFGFIHFAREVGEVGVLHRMYSVSISIPSMAITATLANARCAGYVREAHIARCARYRQLPGSNGNDKDDGSDGEGIPTSS